MQDHLVGTAEAQNVGDLHAWQNIIQEKFNGDSPERRHLGCGAITMQPLELGGVRVPTLADVIRAVAYVILSRPFDIAANKTSFEICLLTRT